MLRALVILALAAATAGAQVSDPNGDYLVTTDADTATVTPRKQGDLRDAVSSLDAAWVLQYAVGKRELDADQLLACDVTGNGTCSSLDAARILQLVVGKITRFPAAELCGSDWLWVPQPGPVPEGVTVTMVHPLLGAGACRMGAIRYDGLTEGVGLGGQDFRGIVLGDVTGSWQP